MSDACVRITRSWAIATMSLGDPMTTAGSGCAGVFKFNFALTAFAISAASYERP